MSTTQHDKMHRTSGNVDLSWGLCRFMSRQVATVSALWMFVVQREVCGLRENHRSLMRDYGVPAEVQGRMGVFPATPR